MAMQMYSKAIHSKSSVPTVTLGKASLSFNSAARSQFLDIKKPYALLAYDPDTRQIGIQLSAKATDDSLSFNFGKQLKRDGGCASLSAMGFVKQFGFADRWRYDIEKKKDWLILTPKEGYVPKEIPGRKKQPPHPQTPGLSPLGKHVEKDECPKNPGPGRPPKPADGEVFKCGSCGYSPMYWRNRKQFPYGHPAVCKCRHTVFVQK